MSRKTTKTPTEIAQEALARYEAAKAREARSLAQDNPAIQELQTLYDSYSKDIAAISRQLKGPQSFENRRQGFELRLAEINAGEKLAMAQDVHYREARDYLRVQLSALSDKVAAGEAISKKELNTIVKDMPQGNVGPLLEAFDAARLARKAYTGARSSSEDSEPATEMVAE